MSKFLLGMVTFKCKAFTQLAVESILANTDPDTYHLVIVDNGSNDETSDMLKLRASEEKQITLISNPENIGFPAAVNQIIDYFYKHKEYDYLTTVHSDIYCTSHNWNMKLLKVFEQHPEIKCLGPITTNAEEGQPYYKDVYDNLRNYMKNHFFFKHYAAFNNANILHNAFLSLYNNRLLEKVQQIETDAKDLILKGSDNSFLTFKREVIEKIGYFDEAFFPGMGEDSDYERRMQREGFGLYRTGSVYIHHWCSVTYWMSQVMDGRQAFDKNTAYLAKKTTYDQECVRTSCINNNKYNCQAKKELENFICQNYKLNEQYNKLNVSFYPVK